MHSAVGNVLELIIGKMAARRTPDNFNEEMGG